MGLAIGIVLVLVIIAVVVIVAGAQVGGAVGKGINIVNEEHKRRFDDDVSSGE